MDIGSCVSSILRKRRKKMKNRIKTITFLMAVFMIFSTGISYGTKMTSDPQIKTRGLVFNTGTSSDQIRMLKDFFRAKGEANVAWGYDYDNRTKDLVRSYQRQVGLGVDGIAGRSTIDRINKDIRDNNVQLGLRVPEINFKGDLVLINKSSNTLYFLKDGIVHDSYPVATGKTAYLTPNGRFKLVVKYKNPAWGGAGISAPIPGGAPNNPLGKRWMGLDYGGGGKYGIHGNANASSIGTYASLGCVRMFNPDSEKLYEKLHTGTPIWIGDENLLQSYGVKFKSNYIAKKLDKKEEVVPQKPVYLKINGENVKLNDPVIIKNGTSYYPFREILEFIDAQVSWDNESKTAKGVLGENFVSFQLGKNEYINNDIYKYLPEGQRVFIENDKTYIPIRNLMEALGFEVSWEDASRTVLVNEIIKEEIIEEEIFDYEDDFIEEENLQEELFEEENEIFEEDNEDDLYNEEENLKI